MKICILIYANHHVRESERFLESFVQEGFSLEDFIIYNASSCDFQVYEYVQKASLDSSWCIKLIKKISNRIPARFYNAKFIVAGVLSYFLFNAFLKKNKVRAVVVFEANIGYGSEFYFEACKKNLIPLYIMPYSFASWLEPCISYYRSKNRSFLKRPLWCSSKWFSQFKGHFISRLYPMTTFLMDILGFSSFRPAGDSSASIGTYILESRAFAHHLIREGIDPERILVLGSYNLYLLNKAKNEKQDLLETKRSRVVFQMPPDLTALGFYFDLPGGYDDLLKKIFRNFEKYSSKVEFVIIHHPLTVIPNDILKEFNITLSKDTVFEVIAGCDAYIASISSTIRWALALHLPVINFDFYKFGYTEFVCAENLCYTDSFDDFAMELENLVNSLIDDKKTDNIFQTPKKYWGAIDASFPNNFLKEVKIN